MDEEEENGYIRIQKKEVSLHKIKDTYKWDGVKDARRDELLEFLETATRWCY